MHLGTAPVCFLKLLHREHRQSAELRAGSQRRICGMVVDQCHVALEILEHGLRIHRPVLVLEFIEESFEVLIGSCGCDVTDAGSGTSRVGGFGSGWEDGRGKRQDRH